VRQGMRRHASIRCDRMGSQDPRARRLL
jgi:hypothetical protein